MPQGDTETIEVLRATLARAAYVAEHLFYMISEEDWRATGGDDMQGHYEGDYHAEQVWQEIEEWRAMSSPGIPGQEGEKGNGRD